MKTLLIRNGTIINEGNRENAHLLCRDGFIEDIFHDSIPDSLIQNTDRVIDATGQFLIPGIIDDQVHFREPGLTQKGDIHSESKAALAGGITSFMEMPNTSPPATTISLLEDKFNIAAEKSMANYSFYLGATNSNIEELIKADSSIICGIKIFMGSSTGNMLVDDKAALSSIFSRVKIPIAVHAEDETVIKRNSIIYRKKYGENIPIEMHPLIRSEEACYKSSSYAVNLARKYETRLHILHISTAKEMELFNSLTPPERERITSEVCIHHLWFDKRDYAEYGTRIKWNPAIKNPEDRDALINGLNNGLVDIVATDHAPHTLEEKSNSYFKAPSGGPMVQHSLNVMMELMKKGTITPEKIVEKMCHAPARIFNINRRGFIRKGYYADLVLIDPDCSWIVSGEDLFYKCGWSPLEGQFFTTKVTHTILNGMVVYENGKVKETARGQQLKFNR